MRRRRESQISNRLTSQNNFTGASRFFVHFLNRQLHDYSEKMPYFTFCEGRKQAMTNFILFMNLDMVDRRVRLHLTK